MALLDRWRDHPEKSIAVIDADSGIDLSYGDLFTAVERARTALSEGEIDSVALWADQSYESLVIYLACLEQEITVALIDPRETYFKPIASHYEFAAVAAPGGDISWDGYWEKGDLTNNHKLWVRSSPPERAAPHKDLAVLLATSGSTGDPKMVRLSHRNIEANATSICEYLDIGSDERAIASLPMHYSYGLSVVNSHLLAGACIVLTGHSFMRPEFWEVVRSQGCTSFAGVPYMYEILKKLRYRPSDTPSIRTLTQAGGRLDQELIRHFSAQAEEDGCRFFVMYGQTEATARISYLPPQRLSEKLGSIGVAVPRGKVFLGKKYGDFCELLYEGPNVMMGYAQQAQDLSMGDELGGVLKTGDLAEIDDDGFVFLRGRIKRIAKIFGRRIGLDSVESQLIAESGLRLGVVESDGVLHILAEGSNETVDAAAVKAVAIELLAINPRSVAVTTIERLPVTSSKKTDYAALKNLVERVEEGG